MKRNKKLRLSAEQLECRRLLTSLPAVSITSSTFEFPGGFEASVLGGELTDLNKDSTGPIRQDQLDYAIIREGNVVEFWIHQGEGKHSRAAREKLAARPSKVVPADLNHDGYDDYLVATTKGIEVFLNLGADVADNRAWRGVEKAGTVNSVASSVALARMDTDGVLDLVITTGKDLEVHPGNGDGTFAPSISYPIGTGFHSVATGHLNEDRRSDVVVGTQIDGTNTGKAVVFLNDGEGILEAGQTIADAGPVRTMALADLNADESAELIVGTRESRHLNDPGGENIHIWNGNGDGTFAAESANYETAGSPLDFAVDDLNSDGIEDLIVGEDGTFHHPITNNGPGGVNVLLGAGNGALLEPVRISSPGGLNVSTVNSQITSFQQFGNTIQHVEWSHELTASGEDFAAPVENLYTRRITSTGDFNGDEILDAAVADVFQDKRQITIHLRNADGESNETIFDLPADFSVNELDVGDLNGDGRDDLAITGRTTRRILTSGFLSNGDGTFSDPITTSLGDFQPLEIVDIDGDGLEDWLGVRVAGLAYLKSNPDGTRVSVPLSSGNNSNFRNAVVSSRNEDGNANLLALSGEKVHSLVANNEGEYTETSVTATQHFSTFGDFNGDGHADVAYGLFSDSNIRAIFGSESGALSRPMTVATREGVQAVATFPGEASDVIALIGQTDVELLSLAADSMPDAPTFDSTIVQTNAFVGAGYTHDLLGDATPDLVMVQGNNFFSASPSTQILVVEAMPDGSYGHPRQVVVPLIEGQVLAAESTDRGIEFLFGSRWGLAAVEIGPGKPGDFNFNGQIDTHDIGLLCAAHQEQDENTFDQFDLDGDQNIDDADIDIWIRDIAQTRRGDMNFDGKVNFSDFLFLSANFGQTVGGGFLGPGGWTRGDTDCDGEVTFADFLNISRNFGFGTSRG